MKDKFYIKAAIGLAILGVVIFIVTYNIRSRQIDDYIEHMTGAVDNVEDDDVIDITAIKVGYEGKTYTLDEFVELDELPVIVDILIMQSDGTMSNKPAYVSFAVDGSEEIEYIDGSYGRLILPEKYNKGES